MKKKKSGFTLIELIISTSLLVLVTLILFTAFDTSINIINFSNNKSTLQSECESIEETISKIGMQANSVTIDKKSDQEIDVSLKLFNEEGNLENYSILYRNNILFIGKEKEEKQYSENVNDFSITSNEDGDIFNIHMNLTKGYHKNSVTYPINNSIVLRNKYTS